MAGQGFASWPATAALPADDNNSGADAPVRASASAAPATAATTDGYRQTSSGARRHGVGPALPGQMASRSRRPLPWHEVSSRELRFVLAAVHAAGPSRGQCRLNGPQTTGRVYRDLSEVQYRIRRDNDVRVPLRDGTVLLADVYRPDTDAPVPALVAAAPYPRLNPDQSWTHRSRQSKDRNAP